jgi:hypothetical protein
MALLAGCSLFADEPEPVDGAGSTPGYPRSWIWSAAPGLSVQVPDAVAVRAWVESADLYQDVLVSYPGFEQATAKQLFDGLVGADLAGKIGGTDRVLIRSLTVTGDELRARLCVDTWDTFYFNGDSGSFIGAGFDLSTNELVMRRGAAAESIIRNPSPSGEPPAAHPVPSPNPGRLVPTDSWLKGPTTSVFSGWVATAWDGGIDTPSDCVSWFKRNHPGMKYPTGYTADSRPNRPAAPPPPTLPASPGW